MLLSSKEGAIHHSAINKITWSSTVSESIRIMSSLQALQNYESSESESEDNDHNFSLNGKEQQKQQDKPRSALPAVPTAVLAMFGGSPAVLSLTGEDADVHDGRIRSFQHVAGNWATYVYISVELTEQLHTLLEDLLSSVPSTVDIKPVSDLHISISRTVALQYQWIDPFVECLNQRLGTSEGFSYCYDDVELYTNDEMTRSFVGLRVGHGHAEMLKLVKIVDSCLREFALPEYYEDPSFHLSFGWCLGDYRKLLDQRDVSAIKNVFKKYRENVDIPVTVSDVCCKAGCKQFRIPIGR